MRLAIADPPYLGRAEMFYGERDKKDLNVGGRINGPAYKADRHPDAHLWDDPATHRALVLELVADFDGWAIAMVPDNLYYYLRWVPRRTRIAVWHDPKVMPTGAHPRRRWEAVLVYVPDGRRRVLDLAGPPTGDVFTQSHAASMFVGAKPAGWTRWVLNMLGFDAGTDDVVDLFPGSGAVEAELAQGVMPW